MTSPTDQQLLCDYAEHRSESAFAELVRRHVDLVYSAALRMVRDSHLAQDVTQAAFLALAQNARKLADRPVISGWLHRTAQNLAANAVRSDVRRRAREQEAAAMNELLATAPDAGWEYIAPHLDEALAELNEPDRDALFLRYFERKSAREIAQVLGTSEEAAQKRVNRGVERLREFFAKRGVAVGGSGLVVLITTNAVQAAPAGLALTISSSVVIAGATLAATTTQVLAMTTLQKTLIAATLAVVAGTGLYQAHQASQLREQNQILRQQQAPLAAQIQALQNERDAATNRLAALTGEIEGLRSNSQELLKLRSEVTKLRESAKNYNPAAPGMKAWSSQVALLKQKLELMPNRKIPELVFASEKNWEDAARGADLNTEEGVREALSKLREEAINMFLNGMMKDAFKKYLAAHDNILPADLYQLKPYFAVPVTDEMLARYQLLQTGKVDNSADLVRLIAFADNEHDSNHGMSIKGDWIGRFNRVLDSIHAAIYDFQTANSGQTPTEPSQLLPYLKEPVETATIQKYLAEATANPLPPEYIQVLRAYAAANNGQSPQSPLELLPYINPTQLAVFEKHEPDAVLLAPALRAYWAANNGQPPRTPSDLLPFLVTPEQRTAFQRFARTGNLPPK